MPSVVKAIEARYKLQLAYLAPLAAAGLYASLFLSDPWTPEGGAWLLVTLVLLRGLCSPRHAPICLLDFACFRPPQELRVSRQKVYNLYRDECKSFTQDELSFMEHQLRSPNSGIGDFTALPPSLLSHPFRIGAAGMLEEIELACYGTAANALRAAKIAPNEVDIVVTSCTMFAPVPSFSAMIANHFHMRSDVANYSCGGQGCAFGVGAIELAQKLLQAQPGKVALVVIHENITPGGMGSHEKGSLRSVCLFRLGAAAIVLSNRRSHRQRAKYELQHTVRTILTDDASATAITVREDTRGIPAVFMEARPVLNGAATSLTRNLRAMGLLTLPFTELAEAILKKGYTPRMSTAFDHILVHTGAKLVIDKVAQCLQLSDDAVRASRETLYTYGNTSGASTYYILANIESKTGVKRGERVLQLGFGSGFKCCSAQWRALRRINTSHPAWEPFKDVHAPGEIGPLSGNPPGSLLADGAAK